MSAYENLYNIIQKLPQSDGDVHPDVKATLSNFKTNNIGAIMAFPVKVGGTFLRTALIHLLSKHYQSYLLRGSYASTDQSRDLYFPSILHHYVNSLGKPSAMVAHCHMYATKPVTSIIELFQIPVLVNARNILDTLLSYTEMVEKMHKNGEPISDDFILQTHTNYSHMSEDERRWHIVNVAPIWYSRFYAYWIRYTEDCQRRGIQAPVWTNFQELEKEPAQLLSKIAALVDPGYSYSQAEVQAALDQALSVKDKLRFNKGVSGRGAKYFTTDEQDKIHKLMATTPEKTKTLEELGVL